MRLSVLKSLRSGDAFLDSLNRLLLALGLAAVLGGSALVFFISHTFTRPLGNLVAGVRALEKGDFTYALDASGGDETAEVTGAFNRMRSSLRTTQQELLEAETAGHHWTHGEFDLARFAALAGGDCGQRGISLREPLVVRSAGRALSGNPRGGESDDRSHRLAAGIFTHPGIAAARPMPTCATRSRELCRQYACIRNFTRSEFPSASKVTVRDGSTRRSWNGLSITFC